MTWCWMRAGEFQTACMSRAPQRHIQASIQQPHAETNLALFLKRNCSEWLVLSGNMLVNALQKVAWSDVHHGLQIYFHSLVHGHYAW